MLVYFPLRNLRYLVNHALLDIGVIEEPASR